MPLFETGDVAAMSGVSQSYASKILRSSGDAGFATQVLRGKWVMGDRFDSHIVAPFLTSPDMRGISLYSALDYHGVIIQIPQVTYVVSTVRTKRYSTPVGCCSVHHINPELFFGYEPRGRKAKNLVFLAKPEKALFDLLYFSSAKSRLFDCGIYT